jgi:hypothetical protein
MPGILVEERLARGLDRVVVPTPLGALPAQGVEELADVLRGIGESCAVQIHDGDELRSQEHVICVVAPVCLDLRSGLGDRAGAPLKLRYRTP